MLMAYPILLFFAVGLIGGFFSGLLGIGGGIIMVPLLSLAFSLLGADPEQVYRLAVGTSLAGITFTSFSSAMAHNKRLPLPWKIIRGLAPWLILGTLLGSSMATRINPVFLKAVFSLFIFSLAFFMLTGFRAAQRARPLPAAISAGAGVLIGGFCSLVGIGGGTIIVPYLHWNGNNMLGAIGASAALGVCISISGALGYAVNGIIERGLPGAGLPWGTLGYIHLPALLAVMFTAALAAPLGAKLAHQSTEQRLKLIFGLVMLLIGTGMLLNLMGCFLN